MWFAGQSESSDDEEAEAREGEIDKDNIPVYSRILYPQVLKELEEYHQMRWKPEHYDPF